MPTATANPSFSAPTLGRHRTKQHGLPPRLHRKGGSYYYVTSGERKWIPLGRDLRAAKARWAELEGGYTRESVATLLERYMAVRDPLSAGSLKQYQSWARALVDGLGTYPVDALQTYHVAQWRDANLHRKAFVVGCLSLLRLAYVYAREQGWCAHDPSPKPPKRATRSRLLHHAEFRAIRAYNLPWLRDAMDLGYLTSLRQSDLLDMRWSAVTDSHIYVRQRKTRGRQEIEITPELRSVLDRCKAGKVLGLYVIADAKGRPIKTRRLQEHFAMAVRAAGVEDARFHDIRALAATDAKKQGLDYQALLGHKSAQQSETYLRGFEAVKATPLKKVL